MKLRARRAEDKGERTAAILKAGREIWAKRSGSEFTMSEVAERAGVVKGTLYLYFQTKEELLQALLGQMVDEYLADVERTLEKRKGSWPAAHIAHAFVENLRDREEVLRLLTNPGPYDAKTLDRLARTGTLIDGHVRVKRGESMRFVLRTMALLTGLASRKDVQDAAGAITALAEGMEKRGWIVRRHS